MWLRIRVSLTVLSHLSESKVASIHTAPPKLTIELGYLSLIRHTSSRPEITLHTFVLRLSHCLGNNSHQFCSFLQSHPHPNLHQRKHTEPFLSAYDDGPSQHLNPPILSPNSQLILVNHSHLLFLANILQQNSPHALLWGITKLLSFLLRSNRTSRLHKKFFASRSLPNGPRTSRVVARTCGLLRALFNSPKSFRRQRSVFKKATENISWRFEKPVR
jgi:hypothetical protein